MQRMEAGLYGTDRQAKQASRPIRMSENLEDRLPVSNATLGKAIPQVPYCPHCLQAIPEYSRFRPSKLPFPRCFNSASHSQINPAAFSNPRAAMICFQIHEHARDMHCLLDVRQERLWALPA